MKVNVEYINPVVTGVVNVVSMVCGVEVTTGKLRLADMSKTKNALTTLVGITGQLHGQVIIVMHMDVVFDIASRMMYTKVTELNDIVRSAISELSNMIMGNSLTEFSKQGVLLDITPPTSMLGTMSLSVSDSKMICIPILYEGREFELNIAVKRKDIE